jgi:protein involved in polysaccharide export with SLBB domain
MTKFFAVLLCWVGLAVAGLGQASLRPGDTLDLRIGGVPPEEVQLFTAQYTVDDDGMLNLPYIGNVRVAGMPTNQAQLAIENKFKAEKIFTNPTITINQQTSSRFVIVGGAVRQPGRVPFTPDLTLTSTINAAGGFNEFANQKQVRLTRGGKTSVFDFRQLRKNPGSDPKILPGDQVEVAQSLW